LTACQPLSGRDQRRQSGEIAPIARSPNGFHILKVLGRRSAVEGKLAGTAAPVQQSHVRHILLRVTDVTPEADVKRRLEEFKLRIDAGQVELGTLARLHSVDPSGSRGGDLGWVYPGDTVPEFERAMNALKLNEISDPVQSPFGWHLIQVTERKTEAVSTDRARQQARQALRERKSDEAYQDWLRQLRDKTYVEYRSTSAARRAPICGRNWRSPRVNRPASDPRSPLLR
jgi:peptidyl-prolyl cis-trans isomerase SurA